MSWHSLSPLALTASFALALLSFFQASQGLEPHHSPATAGEAPRLRAPLGADAPSRAEALTNPWLEKATRREFAAFGSASASYAEALADYCFTTDHKKIGRLYIIFGFFAAGALLWLRSPAAALAATELPNPSPAPSDPRLWLGGGLLLGGGLTLLGVGLYHSWHRAPGPGSSPSPSPSPAPGAEIPGNPSPPSPPTVEGLRAAADTLRRQLPSPVRGENAWMHRLADHLFPRDDFGGDPAPGAFALPLPRTPGAPLQRLQCLPQDSADALRVSAQELVADDYGNFAWEELVSLETTVLHLSPAYRQYMLATALGPTLVGGMLLLLGTALASEALVRLRDVQWFHETFQARVVLRFQRLLESAHVLSFGREITPDLHGPYAREARELLALDWIEAEDEARRRRAESAAEVAQLLTALEDNPQALEYAPVALPEPPFRASRRSAAWHMVHRMARVLTPVAPDFWGRREWEEVTELYWTLFYEPFAAATADDPLRQLDALAFGRWVEARRGEGVPLPGEVPFPLPASLRSAPATN